MENDKFLRFRTRLYRHLRTEEELENEHKKLKSYQVIGTYVHGMSSSEAMQYRMDCMDYEKIHGHPPSIRWKGYDWRSYNKEKE